VADFSQRLGVPSLTTRTLQDFADAVNAFPRFSTFSYTTPESNVTAQSPTIGVNEASGVSGLWFKRTGSGNTGWAAVA